MTDIGLVCVVIVMASAGLPFATYLCAKLAGYGWHRGRQLFFDDHKEEIKHGNDKAKA